MLELHKGITSKVCEVVVVAEDENVRSDSCGIIGVTVDDDATSGVLRLVTVDEGISSGVCETVRVEVTVDDDVSPEVCSVVEKMVDEDITFGVRRVVLLTIDNIVTSEVGMVVEVPIYNGITSGEEVTADDGVTSGICSVVGTLGAIFGKKGFHVVIICQTISGNFRQVPSHTLYHLLSG